MHRLPAILCTAALILGILAAAAAGQGRANTRSKAKSDAPVAVAQSADVTPPPGMLFVPQGIAAIGTTKAELGELGDALKVNINLDGEDGALNYELVSPTARKVEVSAFYLDETEVTNRAYDAFVKATGYRAPEHWSRDEEPATECPEDILDLPVVNVRYIDAVAYAKWAGKRLPTEIEWERAARGDDARRFPWGDFFTERQALFAAGKRKAARKASDNPPCNSVEAFRKGAIAVGSFPDGASPFGAHDMAGNVWEWTASWIGPHTGGPKDLDGEYGKVLKGGSYFNSKMVQRSAARVFMDPGESQNAVGFRCVKSLEPGVDRLVYAAEELLSTMGPDTELDVAQFGVATEDLSYHQEHGHSLGAKSFGFCPISKVDTGDARGLTRLAVGNLPEKTQVLGILHSSYPIPSLGLEPGDYSIHFQPADKQRLRDWEKEQKERNASLPEGEEPEVVKTIPYAEIERLIFRDSNGDLAGALDSPSIETGTEGIVSQIQNTETGTNLQMVIGTRFGRKVLVVQIPLTLEK